MLVTPGQYRHYKGNVYTVLGVANYSKNVSLQESYDNLNLDLEGYFKYVEFPKLSIGIYRDKVTNKYYYYQFSCPRNLGKLVFYQDNDHKWARKLDDFLQPTPDNLERFTPI